MTEPEDPIEELPRQLAVSLGVLALVALVVAGVLGAVTLAAASYLVGDDTPTASEEPTMYFPTPDRQGSAAGEGSPDGGEATAQERTDEDRADARATSKDRRRDRKEEAGKERPAGTIVLHARPQRAAQFARVRLFGRYPGGAGATLQVQREQGRWVSFPTSATVRGGRFETWIQSGRPGINRFRVVDRAAKVRSEPVVVRIRGRR